MRDGIYELWVRLQRINYRLLYFFHGNNAAVVSQGIDTERDVPAKEIDWAVKRKQAFADDPHSHAYEENGRCPKRENPRRMPWR
ncbi:hypothetical protein SBA5_1140009 [Candidatus Sulfotelmatomonas gaucii]|uniref:Uncharacterized protein n=1 Tax=Candidatus Sulfuritelmatomonas gaucii TaxID=2043161 RepID=A0A2N9L3H6_9BACT|nr:hypothetical protein SBA5_1140009 [Candidatus Sulfotelmatomonas gaucii]